LTGQYTLKCLGSGAARFRHSPIDTLQMQRCPTIGKEKRKVKEIFRYILNENLLNNIYKGIREKDPAVIGSINCILMNYFIDDDAILRK
jgi:hypothetical protein